MYVPAFMQSDKFKGIVKFSRNHILRIVHLRQTDKMHESATELPHFLQKPFTCEPAVTQHILSAQQFVRPCPFQHFNGYVKFGT